MIIRILPSALCLLLAPLLVAEQLHNNAQIAVSVDRVAATATQPLPVEFIKTTQTTAPAMQSTSVPGAPIAANAVNSQNTKAGVKSKKHNFKKNVSTAFKKTGEVFAFIALLPLTLLYVLIGVTVLLADCGNGCDM